MENRIFRTKDYDGDIWCEDAIVFPKNKPIEEVFTEENLRNLLTCYSDKEVYSTYIIDFVQDNYVDLVIFRNGETHDNCTEYIHYEFVEMSKCLVIF